MFEEAIFSWRLARLRAKRRKCAADDDHKIRELRRARADREEVHLAEWEAGEALRELDDEIEALQTRHLLDLTGKYLLP